MLARRASANSSFSLSIFKTIHFSTQTFVSNSVHWDDLLRRRCRHGNLAAGEAWAHFDAMLSLPSPPSSRCFNRLLAALSHSGHFAAAITMYNRLAGRADICTVNIAIKCLCRLGAINQGFAAMGTALKRGFSPDSHTLATLLHGLSASGRTCEAVETLSRAEAVGCELNEIAFAAVIAGLCRNGETGAATVLLRRMSALSADCYGPLIDRLWKDGKIDESLALFHEMIAGGVRPDVVVFTSVIHGLCSAGRRTEAIGVLADMVVTGVSPNLRTYSALIDSLCKDGKTREAVSVLALMIGRGLKPDVVVFNSLISGLCKAGQWEDATWMLRSMKQYGVSPDIVTLNAVLDARCKDGNALSVLEELAETDLFPESVIFDSLIGRLCPTEEGTEGREMSATIRTVNIVLNGLVEKGLIEKARKLFDKMLERRREVHVITFNILIKGHCAHGDMDRARELFDDMAAPSTVSYNTLVNGYVKAGRIDVALVLMKEMVRVGLAPDHVTQFILKGIHARRLGIHDINSLS